MGGTSGKGFLSSLWWADSTDGDEDVDVRYKDGGERTKSYQGRDHEKQDVIEHGIRTGQVQY